MRDRNRGVIDGQGAEGLDVGDITGHIPGSMRPLLPCEVGNTAQAKAEPHVVAMPLGRLAVPRHDEHLPSKAFVQQGGKQRQEGSGNPLG